MLGRFADHPASVGETYGQHLATAWGFAFALLGAGTACLLHGLLPFAFEHTASDTVRRLEARMTTRMRSSQPLKPVATI